MPPTCHDDRGHATVLYSTKEVKVWQIKVTSAIFLLSPSFPTTRLHWLRKPHASPEINSTCLGHSHGEKERDRERICTDLGFISHHGEMGITKLFPRQRVLTRYGNS
jgi:hypothetical protein